MKRVARKLKPRPRAYTAELGNKQQPRIRERLQVIAIGCTISLAIFLLLLTSPRTLERLSSSFYDNQLTLVDQKPVVANTLTIIDIDETSLKQIGQWPWSRNRIAELLEKINQHSPAAVGIDALFTEPDHTSPVEVQRQLLQQFGSTISLDAIPADQRDYDATLSRVLASGPFILSYFFDFNGNTTDECLPRAVNMALLTSAEQTQAKQALHQPSGLLCNIDTLSASAPAAGFINGRPDNDGIYRRTPLVITYQDRLYPSFALQTLSTALGAEQLLLKSESDGFSLKLANNTIPLDRAGNLLLHFTDTETTYQHVSASTLLNDSIDPALIKDRIILIGVSATGLQDYRPTPLNPLSTGIEFHATIVDNILQGKFLAYPSSAHFAELSSVLLAGGLFSVLMAWSGPIAIMLSALLSMFLLCTNSYILFHQMDTVISPFPAIVTICIIVIITALFKYWQEQHRSRHITQQILLSQEATIEGFGAMAEYRDPETGGHIKRTQNYVKVLAQALKNHPRFHS
ncbi:MAG: CHASE2 domain-containing protein, partial [Chromatiales bacterium]|nr:CHASE2 domain-containing protein [Chromatiales bacterium]